jgi:hypothetical protein
LFVYSIHVKTDSLGPSSEPIGHAKRDLKGQAARAPRTRFDLAYVDARETRRLGERLEAHVEGQPAAPHLSAERLHPLAAHRARLFALWCFNFGMLPTMRPTASEKLLSSLPNAIRASLGRNRTAVKRSHRGSHRPWLASGHRWLFTVPAVLGSHATLHHAACRIA